MAPPGPNYLDASLITSLALSDIAASSSCWWWFGAHINSHRKSEQPHPQLETRDGCFTHQATQPTHPTNQASTPTRLSLGQASITANSGLEAGAGRGWCQGGPPAVRSWVHLQLVVVTSVGARRETSDHDWFHGLSSCSGREFVDVNQHDSVSQNMGVIAK